MKKVHSRLAKGLAACLLVTALAATPVFAGSIGPNGVDTTGGEIVTIGKDIVIYNDGYNKSYSPSIVYTFTIKAATVAEGTTVTDSIGKTMIVKAGIPTAIVNADADGKGTATVTFTSAEQSETAEQLSMAVREDINFAFDTTKFTAPGIYRYEINDETAAALLVAAGIVRPADYESKKFLDVYVIQATDSSTGQPTDGYTIAGYVLLDETTNTSVTPDTEKDPGFRSSVTDENEIPVPGSEVEGTPGDPTSTTTVTPGNTGITGDNSFDYYYTYNVEVDKVITGNMADKNHAFPFTAALTTPTNTTVGATVYVGTDKTALSASDETSFDPSLANGGKYYIYGVNPLATVNVKEKNDTQNTYTASVKVNTVADGSASDINYNEEKAATALTVSNYDSTAAAAPATITGEDKIVEFTNDMTVGTPTGVMLVAVPFAGVAALAGGALVVSKLHSKKKNDGSELSEELKSE